VNQRNKRKFITSVVGMDTFDLVLKDVAKVFSKRFASSASIVKGDKFTPAEICIQGDVSYDIPDVLAASFKMVRIYTVSVLPLRV
jgi:density-regulated protein DRP1